MVCYTEDIVKILNDYFSTGEEFVESILLATYAININFYNFKIQCTKRVFATIGGITYVWSEHPNASPWGVLVRQKPSKAKLS